MSLALPRSRALRPSMSRRLTSLPSVAPTVLPADDTASTISGSGLFQVEAARMPISAPVPTDDIGWPLVKISASGPMPTSRYCDQTPRSISRSFSRAALSDPGLISDRSVADRVDHGLADGFGLAGIAARLLLDHALQQAGDEGDAAGLDRLQVAPGTGTRASTGRGVMGAVGEDVGQVADAGAPWQGVADHRHRIGGVQQGAHGRGRGRHVVDPVFTDRDNGRTFRQLGASDQGSGAAVLGQAVFGRKQAVHSGSSRRVGAVFLVFKPGLKLISVWLVYHAVCLHPRRRVPSPRICLLR